MPEGPEIRRAADRVEAAIKGKEVEAIFFAFDHLRPWERRFTGTTVLEVATFGKAMLTRFSNGLNIYTHNQLYGRWYCGERDETPSWKRQLRLAIHAREHSAMLYSASDICVLRDDEVKEHPFLAKLGPDLLAPQTEKEFIMERLEERRFRNRQLGGLLTDQSFVAGLGNYLRCEILFVCGLSPARRPVDLDGKARERLAAAMLELPRQSYRTGGITNDLAMANELMRNGASFEAARFRVFRRENQPCYRCATAIRRTRRGGQVTYLCPSCQV